MTKIEANPAPIALAVAALRRSPNLAALFIAAVFLDSLRYKFTNHPKTQVIFGALNDWAAGLGAPGLFGPTGLLSQYVIGSIELLASALLIAGVWSRLRHLQAAGALAGLLVMSGAVSFHLFTPLGVDPNNDGGGLFLAACLNWVFCLTLLGLRRHDLGVFVARATAVFLPAR
jgi:hypothetical protein